MLYQNSDRDRAIPQTYVVKAFAPSDGGLKDAIDAPSTFRIMVFQGPVRTGPTRECLILDGGKKRIADPMKDSRPYRDVDWSLYINVVGGWTQLKGQKRIPWKNDRAHRVLMAMLKAYPYDINRFDVGETRGKLNVSKGRLRSLMTEVRKLVGKDLLPDACRALSQHATIIIERKD